MHRVALLFALAASAAGSAALAQDSDAGAILFAAHCAACHGAEGRGDGPEAPSLNPQPTNLTRLAATSDGAFPTARVVRRINGGEAIVAHGSPMPVYAEFFAGPETIVRSPNGQPVLTTVPIADLVLWLESIQAKD